MKLKKVPFSLSKENKSCIFLTFGAFMSRLDNLCYLEVSRLLLKHRICYKTQEFTFN